MWYFLLSREYFLHEKEMEFRLQYAGKPFTIFIWSRFDLLALLEVFAWGEYEWGAVSDPKIIIDLGAHYGDSALYYHLKYPNALVYAIEPAPRTYERLVRNTKAFQNIIPIHTGIGKTDGTATLHVVPSSLGNSLLLRSNATGTVDVPMCTLASLIERTGRADLIKFDIEGGEEDAFASGDPLAYSDAYIGEVHTDLISISDEAFVERFSNFTVELLPALNKKRSIMRAVAKHSVVNPKTQE
jgi:FkbM family methyltransferase